MSEMIERVARALAKKHADLNAEGWEDFVGDARAAIAAMREPTSAMLKASNRRNDDNDHEEATLENWQAMIDEAMK